MNPYSSSYHTNRAQRPTKPNSNPDIGWWLLAVAAAAVVAFVGIASPRLALRAALILTLSIAAVAVLQAIVRFCQDIPSAPPSEFEPTTANLEPPTVPSHIEALQPPTNAKAPQLTFEAHRAIVTVATERLWARHHLNLYDTNHHPYIQRLVSPELWRAFRGPAYGDQGVPHADLSRLLDELERL